MNNLIDKSAQGEEVKISVRPEEFIISSSNQGIKGKVHFNTFLGKYINYEIMLENGEIIELTQDTSNNDTFYEVGQELHLEVNSKKINVFDKEGNTNLIVGVEKYEG